MIFFLLLAAAPVEPPAIKNAQQLLLVVADDWNTKTAKLQRFKRITRGWEEVTPPIEVVLGENGLAWSRGVLLAKGFGGVAKKLGDDRSVAGVFSLGKIRGYEDKGPPGSAAELDQITESTVCVDDPKSKKFGEIVDEKKTKIDWKHAKKLRTEDLAYAWMIPVQTTGCIAFHLWTAPNQSDDASIVMKAEDLQTLVRWVVPASAVYVALPKQAYIGLKASWRLP